MDPEEAADLDDHERRKQQRRANKDQSPPDYRSSYRDKSRGNDRDRGDRGSYRRPKKIQLPSFRDRLYTRKDFELYQSSRFDRNELADAYNDYVAEYKKDQEYEFYKEHKHEAWFVERYDPSQIFHWKIEQIGLSRIQSVNFEKNVIESLNGEDSEYLALKLEQDPSYDYNLLQTNEGVDILLQKAPLFSFDTDSLTLYLKYIPIDIRRNELSEILKEKLEGFVHLSMSEPMRNHGFERLAWANFSNEHDTSQALLKIEGLQINDFRLSAARSHPNKKKTPIRITPPLPAKQIEYDLQLC